MADNPKVADARIPKLREMRREMFAECRARRACLPAEIQARFEPLLEKMMKGELGAKEAADMPAQIRKAYESESGRIISSVLRAYGQRIDDIMRLETPRVEMDKLDGAAQIFADRKYYTNGTIAEAVRTLVENFDSIKEKSTPISERGLLELHYIRSRHPSTIRRTVKQALDELGHAADDELLGKIESSLEGKEFSLNSEKGRETARNAVLEFICSESEKADGKKPAAGKPAPAQVTDLECKGFVVPARIILGIMNAEMLNEREVREHIGLVIHGYKLGSTAPGIGRKCFPEYAITRNVRQLGLKNRTGKMVAFLQAKKVLFDYGGGTSSINPKLTELQPHWKELMAELLKQHKAITGAK